MTNTIQFLMNPTLQDNLPKMDDHIHPTLDDYCSFCSLYKKSVSLSCKFGRISHVRIKLPKVEENRSIILFNYWKRNKPQSDPAKRNNQQNGKFLFTFSGTHYQ